MPQILFLVNGALVPAVRFQSVSIHDVLGAQPNTATLTFDNRAVHADIGAAIQIGAGSFTPPQLLFAGQVQHLVETYESDVRQVRLTEWPADLIDHVFAINRRRPFESYYQESVPTLVQNLILRWAPAFTTAHVTVPASTYLTINFDGSTTLMDCLNQIAQAIGGRVKVDYQRDVHLFIPPEAGIPDPAPITIANPPLNVPPIQFDVDLSQVRTRVYGKGHGEQTPTDVLAGETIVPVASTVFFNPAGGRAIAALTNDGAQTQQLTYTGVQEGAVGTLSGPGQAPTTAPTTALVAGTGLLLGDYAYSYTFVTPTGETLPSPLGWIKTGFLAAPASPSVAVQSGTGLEDGDYTYAQTFVTATGETTLSLNSASVHTSHVDGFYVPAPSSPPGVAIDTGGLSGYTYNPPIVPGDSVSYRMTYRNASGETTSSPVSNAVTAVPGGAGGVKQFLITVPALPAGATGRRLYRYVNGASPKYLAADVAGTFTVNDNGTGDGGSGSPPGTNTAWVAATNLNRVAVTIAIGPAGTTARKVYRWSMAVPTFRLAQTVANNTSTSVVDTTPNASLGAAAPTTSTATATQVAVSGIAVGPGATTSRKLYRTAVNTASPSKLVTTLANNTATTYTDATPDGSLGAAAPDTDTSGLTQTPGQILAGSSTLITTGAAALPSSGWMRTGQQIIRYTGISGNTLTGIPTTGIGAITTTIPYGAQMASVPALTGVAGLTRPMQSGSTVAIFVQRDDGAAQTALGQLERNPDGSLTDGIREYMLVDERRGEPSLIALCDADLEAFARPIISVTYATRDPLSKAGQTAHLDLRLGADGVFNPAVFNPAVFHTGPAPGAIFGYQGDFLIQEVTITIDPTADPLPRYLVRASSSRFTFQDLLQRVALVV